jgi:hypothetical protein
MLENIAKTSTMLSCEHVSKNAYIWNIMMIGTEYFYNIFMPCRNEMDFLPHIYMDESHKIDE